MSGSVWKWTPTGFLGSPGIATDLAVQAMVKTTAGKQALRGRSSSFSKRRSRPVILGVIREWKRTFRRSTSCPNPAGGAGDRNLRRSAELLREFRASSRRAGSEVRIFCGKLELGIEIFESSDPIDGGEARGVERQNGESGGKAEKSSGERRAARASGDEDDGEFESSNLPRVFKRRRVQRG